MKTRYNTYDIICTIAELQKFIGMRVNNIYDIDNKTYLIRLQRTEEKQVLLLESGIRVHSTSFEWPKNMAPSGFSMKMRKHLKNKRLESLAQLGVDRIVDLKFGSGEAAYHVIIELFDRGNMLLTDHEYVILYVLRPHTEGDKIKFAVKEKYPLDRAREEGIISKEKMMDLFESNKPGDQLKKILVPNLEYGPPLIEHVLRKHGFSGATKIGKDFDITNKIDDLMSAIKEAESLFQKSRLEHNEGYIIQKREERVATDGKNPSEFFSNQEFHPILFEQHKSLPHKTFTSFNEAVDEFFSSLESQKLELRALQQEKDAMKKLANVRKDHDQRLEALEKTQNVDKQKAELITRNQELVDNAILVVQTLLANQVSWEDIDDMVKTAASQGDPVAKQIKQLKLEMNHISLYLVDPFEETSEDFDDDDKLPAMIVEIDLALSAFANARKYYDQKRSAAKKQQKTIESQSKALKSAERKTKQTLKDVQTITNINKARKVYWFEKFFWFVSSENYLVIAGRDQQQNELIVKRYMKPTDVYVHADIHGASSIIIKNPSGLPIPPKTLNEAGTMAICYSVAWDAKVVTNAYWVWGEQVSKTAPTGEYLSTGSFMIRGKKNFLPPTHLVLGLSFLFRLEDGCVEKHKGERKVMTVNEEDALSSVASEEEANEVEVEINDSEGEEDRENTNKKEDNNEVPDGESKLEDISEHSGDSDDDQSHFPDTHIKIQHFAGTKMNLMTEHSQIVQKPDNEENVIFLGDNKPVILKNNKQTKDKNDHKKKNRINAPEEKVIECSKQQVSKRGQKSKLKKIKEKYKDQDDEERKMRMEILQSSGSSKETKKSKKTKDEAYKKSEPRMPRAPAPREPGGEDGDDEPTVQADVDVIDALTGVPLTEDELLFAVPVVAPYNALSAYKFKVKLTPGTARRGKAAKTAVTIFLKDRSITQREKDLLKAVKDEQLARNIPGKVKLSAPKLQVVKK